jgi:hypothetical protein
MDQLLASEGQLAAALSAVQQATVEPAEREAVTAELAKARAALERCRRVGGALAGISAALLESRGIFTDYDRAGAASTDSRRGAAKPRVSCRA